MYEILLLDCVITLLDIAYSARPTVGTTMSILYYKVFNDNTSGIGIYATTDSNIVAGIVSELIPIQSIGYY